MWDLEFLFSIDCIKTSIKQSNELIRLSFDPWQATKTIINTLLHVFITSIIYHPHCAAYLQGLSVAPDPPSLLHVTNGSIQLHSFTAEATIHNADNKPRPCAHVLALGRFCFIYSSSSSGPFLLPGCLTSHPESENVWKRCIVPPPLCRFRVQPKQLFYRGFLNFRRETCEGQRDSFHCTIF